MIVDYRATPKNLTIENQHDSTCRLNRIFLSYSCIDDEINRFYPTCRLYGPVDMPDTVKILLQIKT